jgi:hypothetical protein
MSRSSNGRQIRLLYLDIAILFDLSTNHGYHEIVKILNNVNTIAGVPLNLLHSSKRDNFQP